MNNKNYNSAYAVSNLQKMLSTICASKKVKTNLTADGIYGQETAKQISSLQKQHGIPVTGVTDEATWKMVAEDYETARLEVQNAEKLYVPLSCGQIIKRGEYNSCMLVVQAVLKLLSESCENFTAPEINGTLDMITAEAIEAVQMMGDLPVTGELDKKTWKLIASHFPLAVFRSAKRTPPPHSDCYCI